MWLKRRHVVLIMLFVLYFSVRLFFSLQSTEFNTDYSYFALRQIDHIKQTGLPLTHDELSYGGRNFLVLPFYFYLLAFFTLFLPKIIGIKIITNLLASTLIIAVYLVCNRVLKKRRISIICSVMAAAMPIYINETLNNINPLSILLPGSLFLLYFFLNLREKNAINYVIPLSIALILASSGSFILMFSIVVYLILKFLDKHEISKIRLEFASFFFLLSIWLNILFYKYAFQTHGFSIIQRNLPTQLLNTYFSGLNLQTILLGIGVFPVLLGLYTASLYLFRKKSENMLLFISLAVSILGLLWLKLVAISMALAFLGVALVVLFGQSLRSLLTLLKKTKFSKKTELIFNVITIILVIIQVIPAVYLMYEESNQSYTNEYIDGFKWLALNTPNSSVVLGLPEEGHLITYYGNRTNVIDTDFLLVNDADARYNDVFIFYSWKFKIPALRILEKYNVDYVIVSDKLEKYGISQDVLNDESCFVPVYNKGIIIYRNRWNKDVCEGR